jgi:hypothetical protein
MWHTHGMNEGEFFTNCPTKDPTAQASNTPSPEDWAAQEQVSAIPGYIIDKWKIQRLNPHGTNISARSTTDQFWSRCSGFLL